MFFYDTCYAVYKLTTFMVSWCLASAGVLYSKPLMRKESRHDVKKYAPQGLYFANGATGLTYNAIIEGGESNKHLSLLRQ